MAALPTTTALMVPVQNQKRNLEILSTYWLASWSMVYEINILTIWPLMIMDMIRPSGCVNKVPLFHWMHEKRNDAKLQRAMDGAVTTWTEELDVASIDMACSRTF